MKQITWTESEYCFTQSGKWCREGPSFHRIILSNGETSHKMGGKFEILGNKENNSTRGPLKKNVRLKRTYVY